MINKKLNNVDAALMAGGSRPMHQGATSQVDPMTGMPQANQLAPTAIIPNALVSMQPQIPSIAGQQVAGAYDRVMPAPAQTGLAAPLNIGKPVAQKPNYTMPEKTKYLILGNKRRK